MASLKDRVSTACYVCKSPCNSQADQYKSSTYPSLVFVMLQTGLVIV